MSRDNIYSHQHRSRSRSFSAYRYNNSSRHHHRLPSPGPPPKYRKRSESPLPVERYRYSRSSLSPLPIHKNGGRNGHRSRTPEKMLVDRRRRSGSNAPEPSPVLGVFGLHVRTTEGEIRDIFDRFGPIEKVHMVFDAKSQGFRGYCFIYFTKVRDATAALNETNGIEVKDRRIRVDYSKTKRAHTPTPGFYRGKRGQRSFDERPQRPSRREFTRPTNDRARRDEPPRHRSRERFDRPIRDMDRDREMRNRSIGRRRSVDRGLDRGMDRGGMSRRSPRRDSFRRRDRS